MEARTDGAPIATREVAPLSEKERERLEYLEERIAEGLEVFNRVGMDLIEIRDERLYRLEYPTFEAYCRSRWNISRPYAYELMAAAEVAGDLSGIPDTPSPTAASQVLPLKKLETAEERREVWHEAVEEAGGKTPTAAIVKTTVERKRKAKECEPVAGNAGASGDYQSPVGAESETLTRFDLLHTIATRPDLQQVFERLTLPRNYSIPGDRLVLSAGALADAIDALYGHIDSHGVDGVSHSLCEEVVRMAECVRDAYTALLEAHEALEHKKKIAKSTPKRR